MGRAHRNKRVILLLLAAILVAACAWGGLELLGVMRHRQTKAWCEDVAAAVEKYRAETGHLPKSLSDVRELPSRPFLASGDEELIYRVEDDAFTLEFFVRDEDSSSGTRHVLDSTDDSWHALGYIGPGA